jgi:hypothetical protein
MNTNSRAFVIIVMKNTFLGTSARNKIFLWPSLRMFLKKRSRLPLWPSAPCYPRYLGITRRSCLEAHMVLDMEYREQERPEHGPGGPIFFFSASFVLSAVPASITTGLGLHQKRFLLHEVIGPRYHGMCHI